MFVNIKPSNNKDKKYTAIFYDKNKKKVKTTHFGGNPVKYQDYTIHKDDERKKRYLDRHRKRENWDNYMSAGSLSRYILWNKPTLQESIKDYAKKFNLKLL